jgi:hypothetical protein
MMNCPNCGQANSENAKFCGKCGALIQQTVLPPVPPALTPQPPPIQPSTPGGFLHLLVTKSGLLGLILLALFFLPWGKNVVHPVMNAMQLYSKQFIYIYDANFVFPLVSKGIIPADTAIYLLHYLFLFIPLTALTVFLWKTGRKVFTILSSIFSLLAIFEIVRTMVLEISSGEIRVSFLNIFEGLCLLFILFILVVSIMLMVGKTRVLGSVVPSDWLTKITSAMGFLLAIVFWLPIQIMAQIKLVVSILNIEQSPFLLPAIIKGNYLLMKMGLLNPRYDTPIGRQIVLAIFGLFLLSIFATAIFAVLTALGKRKNTLLLLGFSAFSLIILFLRMRVLPLLVNAIQYKRIVQIQYLLYDRLSIFYYLQVVLLLGLLVCAIMLLARKKTNMS